MSYRNPKTVKSPTAAIRHLEVLYDGGEQHEEGNQPWGGWSVASMEYYESPTYGFRWNGYDDSAGHPQSRGISTWEVLPPPFHALIREMLKNAPPSSTEEDDGN